MADLGTLESELGSLESQMSQYTSDLPSQILAETQKSWTPALEGATGATEAQMQQYVPEFFGIGEALGGTSSADLSPTQKLSQAGTTLGNMVGRLTATQRVSDYLGAQMSDSYNRSLQAMQFGQQQLADAYARKFQEYQMAWQEVENAKDRAMRGGGSGSSAEDNLYQLTLEIDQAKSLRKSGDMSAKDAHDYVMQKAAALGFPITSEDAWVAVGNTPKAGYTPTGVWAQLGFSPGSTKKAGSGNTSAATTPAASGPSAAEKWLEQQQKLRGQGLGTSYYGSIL